MVASGQRRRKVNDQDWVVVDQSPAPGTPAKWGTRLVFRVLAYGDPDAPPAPDRTRPGRMPELTCFDLQEAQDTLQSAGFATRTISILAFQSGACVDGAWNTEPAEWAATRAVVAELGLGRERVMSQYGRDEAADRWVEGEGGPHNAMTKQAPGV